MNYQASNPKSLSETPERLSETKTRSGSPAAAAKKRAAAKKQAAEVLTSCTNPQLNCSICAGISRKCRGGERFTHYQTLYQSLPELRASERVKRFAHDLLACGTLYQSCHLRCSCVGFYGSISMVSSLRRLAYCFPFQQIVS